MQASTGVRCGLAVAAILLSPIALIFCIPLAVGIGLDVFELAGEAPVALALCGPPAVLLLRRTRPRQSARRAAVAPPLSAAGHPN